MRKPPPLLQLFLVIFFLCSCSRAVEDLLQEKPIAVHSTNISLENALNTANNMFAILDGSGTKSSIRTPEKIEILHYSNTLTKSEGEITDTSIYVVNYGNTNGFAILGADTRLDPIYAISDEGSFNLRDSTDNPGIRLFLAYLRDETSSRLNTETTKALSIPGVTDYFNDPGVQVQNLIVKYGPYGKHRKWGQRAPFNTYCFTSNGQQAVAGCVTVATALVLAHHQYPNEILSHQIL